MTTTTNTLTTAYAINTVTTLTLTKSNMFKGAHAYARLAMATADASNTMTYRDYFSYALRAIHNCELVVARKACGTLVLRSNQPAAEKQEPKRKQLEVGASIKIAGNITMQRMSFGYKIEGKLTNGTYIISCVTNHEIAKAGIVSAINNKYEKAMELEYTNIASQHYAAMHAVRKYQSVGYVA